MNDQDPRDQEHQDLGSPVSELKELLVDARPEFLARVRGGIHRRLFAGETTDFVVMALVSALREYLDLIMNLFSGSGPTMSPQRPPAREKD